MTTIIIWMHIKLKKETPIEQNTNQFIISFTQLIHIYYLTKSIFYRHSLAKITHISTRYKLDY
jgi:hypothetical protein